MCAYLLELAVFLLCYVRLGKVWLGELRFNLGSFDWNFFGGEVLVSLD